MLKPDNSQNHARPLYVSGLGFLQLSSSACTLFSSNQAWFDQSCN